jgi:sulfur relay (sulfurtransferase) complex TusBCD TusD component (DsrE family)
VQRRIGKAVIGVLACMGAVGCGTAEETPETALAERLQAVAVTDGPDFIVKSVKGPANVRDGEGFTATVTLCNQGTQPGQAEVGLYFSVDAAITVPTNPGPYTDQPAGFAPSDFLEPGACQTLSVPGHASVFSPGAYYLGAAVDPRNLIAELRETNNTRVGNPLGVGTGPDFIISSVEGPVSSWPGVPFTATVRVCNQGTAPGNTEVALYLSDDTVIEAPGNPSPYTDQLLGSKETRTLEEGDCETLSVPAYTGGSLEEGAYYLGAVADPFNSVTEFLEDNNAKAGSRVGLGNRPDFIVSKVSGPPSAGRGQDFPASVTVCNQGTMSGETDVELYLSADKVITPQTPEQPGDLLLVPSRPTGFLEPGQCRALAFNARVSGGNDGAYYLGAAVNVHHGSPELIGDNNTRASSRFGVGEGPDFVVSQVSGPTSAERYQDIEAKVTVCNQGTRQGAAEVSVYLSTDATITPDSPQGPSQDYLLGHQHLPSLEPGQCQPLTVQGTASIEGVVYLGAVVDPWNYAPELIEDNNTKASGPLGIGNAPDFVVTQVSGPPSIEPWESFQAAVTVCNQGSRPGSTELALYLSQDTDITPYPSQEDAEVGHGWVDSLVPGACQTVSVQASSYFGSPEIKAAYLGAGVNPRGMSAELLTSNNTKVGPRVGVGHGPDFVITQVTGPARVQGSEWLTASVKVCNQGTREGSTHVSLYLSEDAVLTPPSYNGPSWEPRVADQDTGSLAPGACQVLTLSGPVWLQPGAYYLAALADFYPGGPELLVDNNTKVGKTVSIVH